VKVWGKPSSGWRHWLCRLGGIIGVVFGLETRCTPNVGKSSQRLFDPEQKGKRAKVGMVVREDSKHKGLKHAMKR
jgi:hypothetical protein